MRGVEKALVFVSEEIRKQQTRSTKKGESSVCVGVWVDVRVHGPKGGKQQSLVVCCVEHGRAVMASMKKRIKGPHQMIGAAILTSNNGR